MKKLYIYTISFLAIALLVSCTNFDKLKMLKAENPYAKDPQSLKRGEVVYKKNCLGCHGAKGLGDGPMAKGLKTSPQNLQEISKKKSANSIAANVTYGKGSEMVAFKSQLSEKEIWDVANFVKSWGN